MPRPSVNNVGAVFLSWIAQSTRSESFAQAVGAESHYFTQGSSLGVLKYVPRSFATLRLLRHRRPRVIFCMNPPYVCAAVALVHTKIFGGRYVLDSHSAAFDCVKWTWLKPLHACLVRGAACSVVTNDGLAARVAEFGGKAVIVSDIPFEFPAQTAVFPGGDFSICYVCTFAHDEPYLEVIEAARALPDTRFYISGNYRKAKSLDLTSVPANVSLTGFLPFQDYANLLRSASAVMALTTRDFTMQRAGSEAVTVGKPLITSDWPTLRRIFRQGTVFVADTAASIADGVRALRADHARLQAEMTALRKSRDDAWLDAKRKLEATLGFPLPPGRGESQ